MRNSSSPSFSNAAIKDWNREWEMKCPDTPIPEIVIKFGPSQEICARCGYEITDQQWGPGFFVEGTERKLCCHCVALMDNSIFAALRNGCECEKCRVHHAKK